MKPVKIVLAKGTKQVGQIASSKRESDFAASSVNDKPPDIDEQETAKENQFNADRPSTSGQNSNNSVNDTKGPSLKELCPYPKADMSKKKRTGKSTVYTDRRVEAINDPLLTIKFMRRKGSSQTFVFPNVEDIMAADPLPHWWGTFIKLQQFKKIIFTARKNMLSMLKPAI
ncbi:hypothetical protein ILUMI_15745 [Ignelater luminosus]|uniref:Uncharacterized protein n=1 Tax=Ignelater luminosus TaxID=2038154 RepID=A0A8K0G9L7_IGNLU|nr:hypothetical protein ILUMI_15745 [Ignelater luminosus]